MLKNYSREWKKSQTIITYIWCVCSWNLHFNVFFFIFLSNRMIFIFIFRIDSVLNVIKKNREYGGTIKIFSFFFCLVYCPVFHFNTNEKNLWKSRKFFTHFYLPPNFAENHHHHHLSTINDDEVEKIENFLSLWWSSWWDSICQKFFSLYIIQYGKLKFHPIYLERVWLLFSEFNNANIWSSKKKKKKILWGIIMQKWKLYNEHEMNERMKNKNKNKKFQTKKKFN